MDERLFESCWFSDHDHRTVHAEELYQAFKARLMRELFPPLQDGERKGPFDVEVVPLKADATAGRG